jgi:transitional endoplasmic reticulum ATPase
VDPFAFARSLRPVLLLWEDLDLTIQNRHSGSGTHQLGELLAQLDGPQSTDGVVTCASTNDVMMHDRALSERPSRFDRVLHLSAPAREARLRMLRQFASGIERLTADLDLLADQTDGLTGADLRELVVGAFTRALDQTDAEALPAVTTEHLIGALQRLARHHNGADRWRTIWRSTAR